MVGKGMAVGCGVDVGAARMSRLVECLTAATMASCRSIPGATRKGTMVALTWMSWLTMSTMWSAVWSWRMRRQRLPVGAPGQQHAHLGLAVGQLGRQLQRRPAQPAVRAVDDVERELRESDPLPAFDQVLRPVVVDVEVHGAEIVGRQRAGVLDGPGGGQVDAVDQDHHHVTA